MRRRVAHALAVCFDPDHLVRTVGIAAVVGTWLTLYNQGPRLLAGPADAGVVLAVFLNFLTPFVVANLGLLSRHADGR